VNDIEEKKLILAVIFGHALMMEGAPESDEDRDDIVNESFDMADAFIIEAGRRKLLSN
jgi:hypothetical protein